MQSSSRKLKVFQKKLTKMRLQVQKHEKKWKSKMASRVLYELSIRTYEEFKFFSQTWNFTLAKKIIVNDEKAKHHEKLNFTREKIQKM